MSRTRPMDSSQGSETGRGRGGTHRNTRRAAAAAALLACAASTMLTAASCNQTPPTAQSLDWSVWDKDTSATTAYAAGASVPVTPTDTYEITFRGKDPVGIRSLKVWADGRMTGCETKQDSQGQVNSWPYPENVSVAPVQNTWNPSPLVTDGFVFANNFVFWDLSCGKHGSGGPNYSPQEFFALSGTLTFHGEETDNNGKVTDVMLDITR